MEAQKTEITKAILIKKNKAGDTMLTDGKVCYKTVVNNTVWFGIKTHIHNGTKQRAQT